MHYTSYLPDFLREIQDFSALGEASDPETGALRRKMAGAAEECFAKTASEDGVSRFERMFGIHPKAGETLEERRFRVLGRLRTIPPLSMGWLRERLEADCGAGRFSVKEEGFQLKVNIAAETVESACAYRDSLRQKIPAAVELKLGLLYRPEAALDFGVRMQTGQRWKWKENENGTV